MQPVSSVKMKKPLSKGSAVAISIVVTFILMLLFSCALIYVSMMRSSAEEAAYSQMLADAKTAVEDASANVAFSPAESIRALALAPSANLRVERGSQDTGASDESVVTEDLDAQSNEDGNDVGNGSGVGQSDPTASVEQQADSNDNTSFGSGVVVSQQGDLFYILTNNHVVKDASSITATIADDDYKADIVGSDETSDLAIVSVKAKDLSVARIGSSSDVTAGDYTMSVGNPYGLNDSMSSGIVSATGRNMMYVDGQTQIMYADMIQTDSAINPGNSGGGLYNAQGNLIGINTLVSGDDSHSDRIGYAIPIDLAIPIAQNLIAGKKAAHASFGVALSNVPADTVSKYGLSSNAGAYVNSITPSGPAEIAGIVPGDIIISYDGDDVDSAQDMLYKIRASVINETKEVKILREGKEMTISIKVGSDA